MVTGSTKIILQLFIIFKILLLRGTYSTPCFAFLHACSRYLYTLEEIFSPSRKFNCSMIRVHAPLMYVFVSLYASLLFLHEYRVILQNVTLELCSL